MFRICQPNTHSGVRKCVNSVHYRKKKSNQIKSIKALIFTLSINSNYMTRRLFLLVHVLAIHQAAGFVA